jgi:4'-phosphopantetheinyl transferase
MLLSAMQHNVFEPPSLGELEINDQEVHLWFGSCEDLYPQLSKISGTLSETERMRADKYKFPKDRYRCIIRNGVLRILISFYLSIGPEKIRFNTNQYGKPSIENRHRDILLNFNLSHSNEMVLFAFTLGRRIGVDIEYMKPLKDMNSVIESNFSSNENVELAALPINKREAAFYHCWTQKEAFVKALGEGLSRGLDQFDVSVLPDAPAALKRTAWDQGEAGRWSLTAIHSFPGYAAALAVEGSGYVLQCREFIL